MRVLLIDNHDSFSAILLHYLWELTGEKPLFFRNDEISREDLSGLDFDAAVLSPGPGHPARVRDFGVCLDLLQLFPEVPVLGVCLGHQGLAHFAGARVAPVPGALHGRPDRIRHDGRGVFRGLSPDFEAIRYHSLAVDAESLPSNLEVTAVSLSDGNIMGVAYRDRPWYGVQFHPESIGTPEGKTLLANFLGLAEPGWKRNDPEHVAPIPRYAAAESAHEGLDPLPIRFRELAWKDPQEVFSRLEGSPQTFWMDASHRPHPDKSGWPVTVMGRSEKAFEFTSWEAFKTWMKGLGLDQERSAPWPGYRGGPIGQFSYELYHATLGVPRNGIGEGEPLARWMLPEGYLVFDHGPGKVYAAWEGTNPPAWLSEMIVTWEKPPVPHSLANDHLPEFTDWTPALSETDYTQRVRSLQDSIARGDTYEACLTHGFTVEAEADAPAVFRRLRRRNPAPYAAYLEFAGVKILSVSPELFLELDPEGVLRSRPIKGTRPRGRDEVEDKTLSEGLQASEKDRAENRMIVDLTRHDFSRVCLRGSVQVPSFLEVETHPAVFQMVSEVRGRLASGESALDAVAACFPGGSMTGAPKERTVEILSKLEAGPRGIYSGALGWFTHGGAFSLSMAIRTLENRGNSWRIGCGGAVLADSDPDAEWREALLKARSVIDAAALGPF